MNSKNAACLALLIINVAGGTANAQTSGPIASYNFDEGTGPSVTDRSGGGHAGTLVNGAAWSSGRNGGGITFDGSDDHASFADINALDGLSAFTVSTWVKFSKAGGGAHETHLIDKSHCSGYTNGGPWELGVSLTQPGKAEFLLYPQGGSPSAYIFSGASQTRVDDGNWHFIAGRYDGTNLSIWVDGSQHASRYAPDLRMSSTSLKLEFGGRCNGYAYPFNGTLDDVRIYARALSAGEIQADMATPVGGTSPPPPPPPSDVSPPSVPTNLRSVGATTSQVALAWSASTDNVRVTGYHVWRNGTRLATVGTTTSYTDSQVTANTAYQYAVSAFDAAGNTSNVSPAISVTTPTGTTPPPSGTRSYTTDFGRAERPLSEGGAWRRASNAWTDVQTIDGVAFGTNGITNGYDDSYALLSGFGPEQTVEATAFRDLNLSPGDTHEVELLLRFSDDSSNARGYECLFSYNGNVFIMRWNGRQGDFTEVPLTYRGYFRQLRTGDALKCTIRGNVITGYINGTMMARGTDSAITSGQPGIGFFIRPTGSQRMLGLTSFTAREGE